MGAARILDDAALPPACAMTARLRGRHGCGQSQIAPLAPGARAICLCCGTLLRRARTDPLGRSLALNLAALSLLAIACLMTLMTVSTADMVRQTSSFSGPDGTGRGGLWPLSIIVLFATVVAPTLNLLAMTYVLVGLRLRRVFALVKHLRPWSMIEVYLLGVAVA